jgi:hypothetical protein
LLPAYPLCAGPHAADGGSGRLLQRSASIADSPDCRAVAPERQGHVGILQQGARLNRRGRQAVQDGLPAGELHAALEVDAPEHQVLTASQAAKSDVDEA